MIKVFRVFMILSLLITSFPLPLLQAKAEELAHVLVSDPNAEAIATGLKDFSLRMGDLEALNELGDAIPLTSVTPSDPDALRLGTLFEESLFAQLNSVVEFPSLAALETEIANASGTYPSSGGVEIVFSGVSAVQNGDLIDLDFDLTATRTFTPTISFSEDDVQLAGGGIPLSLTLTASLSFQYDTNESNPDLAFYLDQDPTFTINMGSQESITEFNSRVGLAEVSVTGTVNMDLNLTVTLQDPDGGGITIYDWTHTDMLDLAATNFVDTSSSSFQATLNLNPKPIHESASSGFIPTTVQPTVVFNGLGTPTITLGSLGPFTNANKDELLTGVAQLAAGLVSSQAVGDLPLPFVQQRLSEFFFAAQPLLDYVQQQGEADIVCGTQPGDGPSPPSGDVTNIPNGATVYCRAYTLEDPTSVDWNITPGTEISGTTNLNTIGTNPIVDAEFQVGQAGPPQVSAQVVFPSDPGNPHTVIRRVRSVQEMYNKLIEIGGINLSPDDVGFDADKAALTFQLTSTYTVTEPLAQGQIDFGDQLRSSTNLAGLSPTSGASASVEAEDVSLNTTFGVLLGDDLDVEKRFFLQVDPSEPVFNANVAVSATVELMGRLGFLMVSATGDAGENPVGSTAFEIAPVDTNEPMYSVDLIPEPGGITTTNSGPDTILNAIRLTDLLNDAGGYVSVTCNVRMSAGLTVEASLSGATEPISGSLGIDWTDVFSHTQAFSQPFENGTGCIPDYDTLQVNAGTNFEDQLMPFDISPSLFGKHTDAAPSASTLTDADSPDFTALNRDLEGVKLFNKTDGSSCVITGVAAHALTCESGLQGGLDNEWQQGDRYEVEGDPFAMLNAILNNLESFVTALDEDVPEEVQDALNTKLPLIAVSPGDLLTQFQDLKSTIDDIRTGTPDAAIMCGPLNAGIIEGEFDVDLDEGIDGDDDGTVAGETIVNGLVDDSEVSLLAGVPIVDQKADLNGDGVIDENDTSTWPAGNPFAVGSGTRIYCQARTTEAVELASVQWEINGIATTSELNFDSLQTVGQNPTTTFASFVPDFETDVDPETIEPFHFVVGVEYTEENGDQHTVGLPSLNPPLTLNALEILLEAKLGLLADALEFDVEDLPTPGNTGPDGTPDLVMRLGYGICTNDGGNDAIPDCEPGDRKVNKPSIPVNIDMDILPGLVGVSSGEEASLDLEFLSRARFDMGISLEDTPQPVVLDTSGIQIAAGVVGDSLDFEASVGPLSLLVGESAVIEGTHTDTVSSTITLTDTNKTFTDIGIAEDDVVVNTDDGSSCVVDSVTDHTLTCKANLAGGTDNLWEQNDSYRIGGNGILKFGVGFELAPDSSDETFTFTGFAGVLSPTFTTEGFPALPGCTSDACGTLSVAFQIGGDGGGSLARASAHEAVLVNDPLIDPESLPENLAPLVEGPHWVALPLIMNGGTQPAEIPGPSKSAKLAAGTVFYLGDLQFTIDDFTTDPTPNFTGDTLTRLEDLIASSALDWRLLFEVLPELLDQVEDNLDGASSDISIPLVGEALDGGADIVGAFDDGVVDPLFDLIDPLNQVISDTVGTAGTLENTISLSMTEMITPSNLLHEPVTVRTLCDDGMGGTEDCTAGRNLIDVVDVRITFVLSQAVNANPQFDFGIPGVPLRSGGALSAGGGWSLLADFGLSKEIGPYLVAHDENDTEFDHDRDDPELFAGVFVRMGDVTPAVKARCDDNDPLDESKNPDDFPVDAYTHDRCLEAQLAFLQVTLSDAKDDADGHDRTELSLDTGLNFAQETTDELAKVGFDELMGASVGISLTVNMSAHVDVRMRTGLVGIDGFPSVLGTMTLDWGKNWEVGTLGDTVNETTPLEITFDNLYVDAGAFVNKFLKPVADSVKDITSPFMPVIETVSAPLPVLSDLSRLVGGDDISLLSLMEIASGSDLTMLYRILDFVKFANSIDTTGENLWIGLGPLLSARTASAVNATGKGSFKLDSDAEKRPAPGEQRKLIKDKKVSTSSDLQAGFENEAPEGTFGVKGLTFPFIQDPLQIFAMLLGQDATLVRWDSGIMRATAGVSYTFRFAVGPVPMSVSIIGSATLEGRFAMGYDTYGIRQSLSGGNAGDLIKGIFIDDLDTNGKDVPEVTLKGTIAARAAVDLVIVSAGVEGGIELTLTMDLDDRPEPDGKLRINEIVSRLSNPFCLFVFAGKLDAFLAAFVKIDLFFFTKEYRFELARVTLLDFSLACDPPKPVLASGTDKNSDGIPDLLLNIGPRAQYRNIQVGEEEEEVTVRQLAENGTKVSVTMFGEYQEYTLQAGAIIWADGGTENDIISLEPGSIVDTEKTDPELEKDEIISFTISAEIYGGPGDDQIRTGDGEDKIYGDGGEQSGDPGNDKIKAGGGNDTVYGGGGDDGIDASFGDDRVLGGDGNDRINGGPGADHLEGQGNDDQINGGPGTNDGKPSDDLGDTLIGGSGSDALAGGFGPDNLFGDSATGWSDSNGNDRLDSRSEIDTEGACEDGANASSAENDNGDVLQGGEDDDWLFGGEDNDELRGGAANDLLCGNGGDDLLDGDDDDIPTSDHGHDELFGGSGHDDLDGRSGNDELHGGPNHDDLRGGDGRDLLLGDAGNDIILGDSGTINDHETISHTQSFSEVVGLVKAGNAEAPETDVVNCSDIGTTSGISDCMYGDDGDFSGPGGDDFMFGEGGNDRMFGEAGDDYMNGNNGKDTMNGNAGEDNMRGGQGDDLMHGDENNDTMYGDKGDDEMFGDGGDDVMRGGIGDDLMEGNDDNDTMFGDADHDEMYGNDGIDTMHGNADDDYMEGNADGDFMYGDGGQDDMIGGSSSESETDGVDKMWGGSGGTLHDSDFDVMAGDNASITRPTNGSGDWITDDFSPEASGVVRRVVELYDVAEAGETIPSASTSGGDFMWGEAGFDIMYGQGNSDETDDDGDGLVNEDPSDGLDNDGDSAVDEDPGGDYMRGGDGHDYMEGNFGSDMMFGDDGQDDMIGGTARTKSDDPATAVDGRLDGTDYIFGGDGLNGIGAGDDHDVIVGDNASVDRPLDGGAWQTNSFNDAVIRDIFFYDVEKLGAFVNPGTSDGDFLFGEASDDVMYGQGGGDEMHGGTEHDYMEGNASTDTMFGDAGQDDMLGGTGPINDDPPTGADDYLDDQDWMYGESDTSDGAVDGDGADFMLGDNGVISHIFTETGGWAVNAFNDTFARFIILRDVDTVDNTIDEDVHGPDFMWGNDNDDQMWGQGDMDEMHGGAGDDYMEGNTASDMLFGDGEDDDMLGGTGPTTSNDFTTAIPGRVDSSTLTREVPLGEVMSATVPLGDTMYGGMGSDVMLGDNGIISRPVDGDGHWLILSYELFSDTVGTAPPRHTTGEIPVISSRVDRDVQMIETEPGATAGSDLMEGGDGEDDMYGQFDDSGLDPLSAIGDELFGQAGEDAMLGDNGLIDNWVVMSPTQLIEPQEPFFEDEIFVQNTLFRQVDLIQTPLDGNDRMKGGDDGDWMHGGDGYDLMNGNDGNDRMFGDDGPDAMWGGWHHDHLYGGNGDDYMDVEPRPAMEVTTGNRVEMVPPDPEEWFWYAEVENFQHIDYIYGGWNQDAMQANVADEGPVPGDRLIDWVGGYNVYYLCPGLYGEFVNTRDHSPWIIQFLQQLSEGDGALDPALAGAPGFDELALVYPEQAGENSHIPHPDNPGHFTCSANPVP